MQKGRRKQNQAGMTLIELVVVILILGILSAGAAVGINYVSRMNSTSAGEKLVSLLEKARVYTISAETVSSSDPADKVKLVLTKEGDTYYTLSLAYLFDSIQHTLLDRSHKLLLLLLKILLSSLTEQIDTLLHLCNLLLTELTNTSSHSSLLLLELCQFSVKLLLHVSELSFILTSQSIQFSLYCF